MESLVALLKDALTSQPILQVFAGAAALIVIAFMVMRAQGDKAQAAGPVSPPAPLHDLPPIFAQGPREMLDLHREKRDLMRRQLEELIGIRECTRVIRGEAERQTEILERIEREQAIANHMHRGHDRS